MRLEFNQLHSYERDASIALPIQLCAGLDPVELTAIVDTGADFCLFERTYAEMLGLEVESGLLNRFRTVAGGFDAFGHTVEIAALGVRTTGVVSFFSDPAIQKNVLGRQGWLDRVRLGIVHYDRMLYLADYNE